MDHADVFPNVGVEGLPTPPSAGFPYDWATGAPLAFLTPPFAAAPRLLCAEHALA